MYRILHADASSHRQQVVHLSDVRLRARRSRIRSKASRIPSARWSSKTIGRCTTGIIEQLGIYHPQQIEFDRLNLTYTLLSKRKLLQLVQEGHVRGLGRSAHAHASPAFAAAATRRRRIRNFCAAIGVSKTNGIIELGLLEHFVREDLNKRAPRVMAVLRPLQGGDRQLSRRPGRGDGGGQQSGRRRRGTRKVPFSRCSTSSRTISARIRRSSSSGSRPGAKCGCATATSSLAPAW